MTVQELKKLKVKDLRSLCVYADLSKVGKKADLINRILEANKEGEIDFEDFQQHMAEYQQMEVADEAIEKAEDPQSLARQMVSPIEQLVQDLAIQSDDDYQVAADLLVQIRTAHNKVSELFDPNIKRLHEAHKAALADRNQFTRPLGEMERTTKDKMAEYQRKVHEERIKEQQRLQAATEEQARRDLVAKAQEYIAQGKTELAQELLDELSDEKPQELIPTARKTVKAMGAGARVVKRFRVMDVNEINRKFMSPNLRAIQSVVDEMGDEAAAVVGGIEVYEDVTISVTGAK